jgi:hypothetical protein
MGMIYVSCGGKFKLCEPSEVHGGSAWGAGSTRITETNDSI